MSATLLIEGKLQPGGKVLVDADKLHELSVLLQGRESDKAELLEALDELIAAEWMVSPSWSSTEMREALLARIEAATNKHRS